MQMGVLGARAERARGQIVAAIEQLADRLEVVVDAAPILHIQAHDRITRTMFEHEAIAAALEQLLAAPPEKRKRSRKDGLPE